MLRPSWELSSNGFTLPRPSCVVRWLVCQRVALHQQGEPRRCPDAASAATAWSVACNEAHASPNLPMHTAARRRAFTSVGAVVPPMKLVVTWAALTLLVQPVTASNPKGLHISDEEAQLHFGPNRECTIELRAGPPPYLESNCPIQAPPPHPAAPPSPPPSAPPSSPPPPVVYAYVLGGLTYGNANSGYGHTDSYSVMNPLIGASAERYNTETGAWSNLPTAPVDFSYSGCAAEVNGSLYYTRGTLARL